MAPARRAVGRCGKPSPPPGTRGHRSAATYSWSAVVGSRVSGPPPCARRLIPCPSFCHAHANRPPWRRRSPLAPWPRVVASIAAVDRRAGGGPSLRPLALTDAIAHPLEPKTRPPILAALSTPRLLPRAERGSSAQSACRDASANIPHGPSTARNRARSSARAQPSSLLAGWCTLAELRRETWILHEARSSSSKSNRGRSNSSGRAFWQMRA